MHLIKRLIEFELAPDRHLLINTLSGALDIVDESVHQAIRALREGDGSLLDRLDGQIVDRLRQRRYLFDTPEEEDRGLEELYRVMLGRRQEQPVQYAICPTYSCNLHCVYCFEGEITAQPMMRMTTGQVDQAFRSIDAINQRYHPHSEARVILFGGEPLLRPSFPCVERVFERAAERGFGVDIVSNGVQAQHFLELFGRHKQCIKQIQITLDGPAEVHDQRRVFRDGSGSFEKIAANVEPLLEEDLPVTIRVNVDKRNIARLPELIDYMEEAGWTLYPNFSCYIYPVTAYSDTEKANALQEDQLLCEIQRMFQGEGQALPSFALHGFKVLGHVASVVAPESLSLKMPPLFAYCEANGMRYFAFGPDGYIYPCGQGIGRRSLAIGKFSPELDLWQEKCGDWMDRNVFTVPQCRECPVATLCGGGCAYSALQRKGTIMAPSCQNCQATLDSYLDAMKGFILQRYSGVIESVEGEKPCA